MKRYATLLLLVVLFYRPQAQMVVTDFGSSTSNTPSTYTGYNNTGQSAAVFGGTGVISNSNSSSGYTGASGGSNVNMHAGENFWVTFNSGSNVLLQFSFAYMTMGNSSLSDPYLEYSIIPGVFLPVSLLNFNNASSWHRMTSSPFVVLPNTQVTLRWSAASLWSSYALLVDDINFSAMTILATAPELKAEAHAQKNVLRWGTPRREVERLSLEKADDAGGKYRTIFETTSVMDNSHTDGHTASEAFYRLRVTDFDGSVAYSKTVRVSRETTGFSLAKAYPNPASGSTLWLSISSAAMAAAQCSIVDLRGNTVAVQQLQLQSGEGRYAVDISRLSRGLHFIRVMSDNGNSIQQFVKE